MPDDTSGIMVDSYPPLPLELEYIIFEKAATCPNDIGHPPLHLLLVSKRVYAQLKPLLYRTLLLCESINIAAIPKGACSYVETLIVEVDESVDGYMVHSHIAGVLRKCSNLRALRLVTFTLYGLIAQIPNTVELQRLSIPHVWSTTTQCFLSQQLSTLTHLDLASGVNVPSLNVFLEAYENFRCLTHLAILATSMDVGFQESIMPSVDQILIKFPQIQYMVIHRFSVSGSFVPQINSDPRVVYMHNYWARNDEDENWMAGLFHHRLDRWEIAEGLREARDGGYFRDKDASFSWITPTSRGLQELLHEWGVIRLAHRSLLWSQHLGVEWWKQM